MPPRKTEPHDLVAIEAEALPAPVVAAAEPIVVSVDKRPWLDMSIAPRDGTLVELDFTANPPGLPVIAVWRITRRRRPNVRGWHVVGYWADPVLKQEIHSEPVGWRMPAGYMLPGIAN